MKNNLLFNSHHLRDIIAQRAAVMAKEIGKSSADETEPANTDELAAAYASKFSLHAPDLHEDRITVDQVEHQVDVRSDPHRAIFDRSRPFLIPGQKVTYFVPFTGNADLFGYQPSTYSFSPPRGEVTKDELALSYVSTDHDAAAVKAQFDRDLVIVKQWLGWTRADVEVFNQSLLATATQAIVARRQTLQKDKEMASSLGYPVRK